MRSFRLSSMVRGPVEGDVIPVHTRYGIYKRKYRLRAAFQSAAFVALVGGFMMYNGLFGGTEEEEEIRVSAPLGFAHDVMSPDLMQRSVRRLEEETEDCDLKKAEPGWLAAFYGIGVLYMFLAIAIVCDEFFVPALEEMASERRMNLSMDVAGATLMAAGGSAPELFSSLFGTFQENDIGFGTIIGSAVFNVLFVIAMCSIFAKEVLQLTWWPLFRDSTYYAVGLGVLAIFVGVVSEGEIEVWEAVILFALYIGYILLMWKNADLYKYLTGKELVYPEDSTDGMEDEYPSRLEVSADGESRPSETALASDRRDLERPSMIKQNSASSVVSANALTNLARPVQGGPAHFRWHGTFRAGILKLMRDPHSWVETGGVGIVAKIAGNADHVFRETDENGDGKIDKQELRKLFTKLECSVSDPELDEVFDTLDLDKDGYISQDEFNKWYATSAELIRSQVRHVFDSLDTNNSGTIDKFELKALLIQLDPNITDKDVEEAIDVMYQHGSREEITFEEFEAWYEKSMIYERQKKAVEEDMEGAWESLKPPYGEGWPSWLQYLIVFPLVFVMAITIPDVRIPGRGKWCYAAFFMSIAWIGAFSYLMVWWAEVIGNTIGIPTVVMGLTVIAAGTSVPDLLSSVIVARRGSGDMAVSSSVGSNIFDILVGLPVPWFLYTVWNGSTVIIGTDNISIWIGTLLGMLVFVILAVHCQGWKLTKTLGAMMILFYFGFLVMAIVLELPFDACK